ncbi:hypothetical protein H2200_006785 [Cladophialophora chaetospira]|uniref:Uncharacterized protein n=1 Tax=Cladophialophora chaetospira TaxID=386627 RepID=A0AA39CI70_9EURO|nr:hypothetical protein H2200_006785 [Cladophialophora chaetospira]
MNETGEHTMANTSGSSRQQLGSALPTHPSTLPCTALSPLVAKTHSLRSEIKSIKQAEPLIARAQALKQDLDILKSEALTFRKLPRRDVEDFKLLHLQTEALGAKAEPLCKPLMELHEDMTQFAVTQTQDSLVTADDWTAKAFDGLRRAYADAVAVQKDLELRILQLYRIWEDRGHALAAIRNQKQCDRLAEEQRRRRRILTRLPLPEPNERLAALMAMGHRREDDVQDENIGPEFDGIYEPRVGTLTYLLPGWRRLGYFMPVQIQQQEWE